METFEDRLEDITHKRIAKRKGSKNWSEEAVIGKIMLEILPKV